MTIPEIDHTDIVHTEMPEHELLTAVLDRAIRDVIGGKISDITSRQCNAREAVSWLGLNAPYHRPDEAGAFSFHWVCEHLGVDPESLHRELMRLLGVNHRILNRGWRIMWAGCWVKPVRLRRTPNTRFTALGK